MVLASAGTEKLDLQFPRIQYYLILKWPGLQFCDVRLRSLRTGKHKFSLELIAKVASAS